MKPRQGHLDTEAEQQEQDGGTGCRGCTQNVEAEARRSGKEDHECGKDQDLARHGPRQVSAAGASCAERLAVRHQPVAGKPHDRETQIKGDAVLREQEGEISCHRQQEEEPKATAAGVRAQGAAGIVGGAEPDQGAAEQQGAPGLVKADVGTQQQPGQPHPRAFGYDQGSRQGGQRRHHRQVPAACRHRR